LYQLLKFENFNSQLESQPLSRHGKSGLCSWRNPHKMHEAKGLDKNQTQHRLYVSTILSIFSKLKL